MLCLVTYKFSSAALLPSQVLLYNVTAKVQTHEDFQVPSVEAKLATKVASGLLEWHDKCIENKLSFQRFSTWHSQQFERCFKDKGSMHLRRERMWREYHNIRTSDIFLSQWKVFLECAGQVDTPTYYQYATHEL